ncbi:hypothetical protein TWF730_001368 [Orbilia blumenaviensis]|uniref:Protein kinase domain-containing protein n=1 Tax=Orbilia blumenaviensis TaxID=1796055 RepID=A0AAV9UIG0_9PEZI
MSAASEIPTFTTEELEIDPALIQPMGHGGHSLVYKIPSAKGFPHPSVLKIFRYTLPPNPASSPSTILQYTHHRDPDYAYFHSEHSSYTRLTSSPTSQQYTPKIYASVIISPSFEPHILANYNPSLHRRRRQSQLRVKGSEVAERLPLKGVLIEYINGLRLSVFPVIPSEIAKKIVDGMTHLHSVGVLHRDVKKRNVMVVPNSTISSNDEKEKEITAQGVVLDGTEKVVWIDFSNSIVLSDFRGTDDEQVDIFARSAEAEMQDVSKMVTKLER